MNSDAIIDNLIRIATRRDDPQIIDELLGLDRATRNAELSKDDVPLLLTDSQRDCLQAASKEIWEELVSNTLCMH